MKWSSGAVGVGIAFVLLGLMTGCAQQMSSTSSSPDIWHVSRAPKLLVSVGAGCSESITQYRDVVNTFPGPPLVPPDPTSGLICFYSQDLLTHQTHLDVAQAITLVRAIRALDLSKPSGVFHCPNDTGAVDVIGFSYSRRVDVGLWYAASGCQSVDNGRLGSFQGGNPSFFVGFEGAFNGMLPAN
jgi:hypothetical protein